jgi:hypothetical protein
MMTPDRSRAAALYVNRHPRERPEVVAAGWDGMTAEQRAEAEALFREVWGRGMEEPPAV